MFRRKKADQSDVREGRGGFDGLWIRLPEAGQVRLDARPEPLGAPPEPDGEAGHDRELPLGVHRPQRHVVPLALLPHEWGHPGPVREHGEHAADHGEVGEGRPVPARLLGLPRHSGAAGRLQARARRPERPWHELQEARSHFGAWCIVSSPLILSHDVNSDAVMEEIWPIISNREAIAVNQAWAGHSGSPFKQSATNITLPGFADQTRKPILGDHGVAKGKETPLPSWHFFYKPLGSGRVAVLLMSHTEAEQSLTVSFADVPGLSCSRCSVRDVWLREDAGVHVDQYTARGLAGHDSAFLVLSPEPPRAAGGLVAALLGGPGAPAAPVSPQGLALLGAAALVTAGLLRATALGCWRGGGRGRQKRRR
ncbi:unnamed protein product [Prorocentrum cordatum]|uniref:alpha-galactosidase n=1 Tax=Prorocentrum cordatum TaxID=2364126 RepID=A0ABN9TFR1_9DINO|nr:unnamed protein product [Polarella glacialis]